MRSIPVLALGGSLLWLGTAYAGPAEDLATVIEMTPGMTYETAVETDDGGALIEGIRADAGFVVESAGLVGAEGTPVADPAAIALVIDSLRLSEGAAAMLVGTRSGAEPGPVSIELEGVRLDLAVLAGPRPADLLREHLGAGEITGRIHFWLDPTDPARQQVAIDLDLQPVGQIEIDLEFDQSGQLLPSGTATFTDSPERGLIGLATYMQRLSLEMAIAWTEATGTVAGPDRDAESEALLELMRSQLATVSLPLPEVVAALANWAEARATELPQHADTLEAVAEFARSGGTLSVTIAPPDPAALLSSVTIGLPGTRPEAEQIADTIEILGLNAEHRPD